MPNPATYVNETPIFEWYMIWCGSKCLTDIGVRAQKIRTILSSKIVKIVRLMRPFNEHKNLHFDNE